MFNFKKCFAGLVGLSLLLCALATLLPLTGRGQGNNQGGQPQFGPRKFYMTNTTHDGSLALSACASGYHMASLWEIFDPSNLSYQTELGLTMADSGSGPPSDIFAWIRTGGPIIPNGGGTGASNCQGWKSNGHDVFGTRVELPRFWTSPVATINPWDADSATCNLEQHVWCVQD